MADRKSNVGALSDGEVTFAIVLAIAAVLILTFMQPAYPDRTDPAKREEPDASSDTALSNTPQPDAASNGGDTNDRLDTSSESSDRSAIDVGHRPDVPSRMNDP